MPEMGAATKKRPPGLLTGGLHGRARNLMATRREVASPEPVEPETPPEEASSPLMPRTVSMTLEKGCLQAHDLIESPQKPQASGNLGSLMSEVRASDRTKSKVPAPPDSWRTQEEWL